MGHKQTLGVGPDLVHDPVVFSQDEVELTVIHLELVFLQEYNLCALGNVNSYSRQAFSFTN